MSIIHKLGISGIRSYSPDSMQSINFKPLTLICGQNGSGKTTILECLKYVTTGAMPPGTMGGKSFILDPKIISRPEVIGEVKLNFNSFGGKKFVVGRKIMLSYVKRKGVEKMQFKTIEQQLKTRDETTNQLVSINHHCAEIDKQVPALFGVSRSVLQNIIFCQQDEALWPFGDNMTLKGIFDQLFETNSCQKLHDRMRQIYKKLMKESRQASIMLEAKRDQFMRCVKVRKNNLREYEDISTKSQALPGLANQIAEYEDKNGKYAVCQHELMQVVQLVGKIEANINNTIEQIIQMGVPQTQIAGIKTSNTDGMFEEIKQVEIQIDQMKKEIIGLEILLSQLRNQEMERQVGNLLEFELNNVCKRFQIAGDPTYVNVLTKLGKQVNELQASQAKLLDFRKQLFNLKDPQILPVNEIQLFQLKTREQAMNKKCFDLQNSYSAVYFRLYNPNVKQLRRVEFSLSHHQQLKFRLRNCEQRLQKMDYERQNFEKKAGAMFNKQTLQQMKFSRVTIREQMLEFAIKNEVCIFCNKELSQDELHEIEEKCVSRIERARIEIENYESKLNFKAIESCQYSSIEEIDNEQRRLQREVEVLKSQINASTQLQQLQNIYNQNYSQLEINRKMDYNLKKHNIVIKRSPNQPEDQVEYTIDNFIQYLNDFIYSMQSLKSLRTEIKRLDDMKIQNVGRQRQKNVNSERKREIQSSIEALEKKVEPLSILKQTIEKLTTIKSKSKSKLQQDGQKKIKSKPKPKQSRKDVEEELHSKRQIQQALLDNKKQLQHSFRLNKLTTELQNSRNEMEQIIKMKKSLEQDMEVSKADSEACQKLKMELIALKTMITTRIRNIQEQHSKLGEYQRLLLRFRIRKQIQTEMVYNMKAVELSITQYHTQKLEQINKILKETWQSIYRRGDYIETEKDRDIEYIRIRSYDEQAGTTQTHQGRKKIYSYALMMGVDGAEIEMKGRCSMGQKVLASIVIRLALADCFARKCNILALDEPTANLDSNHVRSLADSLGKLIEMKNQDGDFQLIVITHDMEFMAMMTKYEPSYYEVKKVDGWSKITLKEEI